jgi:acetyl-CoA carboxylase biotin carboxyl carrier protein
MAAAAPVSTSAPAAAPAAAPKPADAGNLITIKSPMIGTFYRKSSPDKPNFVEIGTDVAPGKVVCIIEAMKLFNEIECEVKGRIVKVLVDDASPVEFDQPLFLVEPA